MEQTFMKERPIKSLVLSMALPMVISMMVNSLYNIVDSYFVSAMPDTDKIVGVGEYVAYYHLA